MKQTKTKEIRKLTWKYFWKQKKEEVGSHFYYWSGAYFMGSFFFGVMSQGFWSLEGFEFIAIIGLCLMGFWVLLGIIKIIKTICNWIKENWEYAKKRATKEVNKK